MRPIDISLDEWRKSLCGSVDLRALYARNPVAHKWKAPFRSMTLREAAAWRCHDLLHQSLYLYDGGHILGARILLRSAFETVAVLIYLNQQTRKVLSGGYDFHEFSEKTSVLLLGSRDDSTIHRSLNIITILGKCEVRYPGIEGLYSALSESAHPNYEGTCIGYSEADTENYITSFSNNWYGMYAGNHIAGLELCTQLFFSEYNEEWTDAFEKLEQWIEENDDQLEATK